MAAQHWWLVLFYERRLRRVSCATPIHRCCPEDDSIHPDVHALSTCSNPAAIVAECKRRDRRTCVAKGAHEAHRRHRRATAAEVRAIPDLYQPPDSDSEEQADAAFIVFVLSRYIMPSEYRSRDLVLHLHLVERHAAGVVHHGEAARLVEERHEAGHSRACGRGCVRRRYRNHPYPPGQICFRGSRVACVELSEYDPASGRIHHDILACHCRRRRRRCLRAGLPPPLRHCRRGIR